MRRNRLARKRESSRSFYPFSFVWFFEEAEGKRVRVTQKERAIDVKHANLSFPSAISKGYHYQ